MQIDNRVNPITVFLSYCHKNKSIAEKIVRDLSRVGIIVIRDEQELKYTYSIFEFMQLIKKADFALLLISDYYLKSKNCLVEVELLLNQQNVWEKILPVTAGKVDIYKLGRRLNYVKYWEHRHSKLKLALRGIDAINALSSLNELKKNKFLLRPC